VRAECRRRIPATGVALAAGLPEIPDRTWASSAGTSSGCTGAREEAAEGGEEAIREEKLVTARNPYVPGLEYCTCATAPSSRRAPRLCAAPVRGGGAHLWALVGRIHAGGDGRRTTREYASRVGAVTARGERTPSGRPQGAATGAFRAPVSRPPRACGEGWDRSALTTAAHRRGRHHGNRLRENLHRHGRHHDTSHHDNRSRRARGRCNPNRHSRSQALSRDQRRDNHKRKVHKSGTDSRKGNRTGTRTGTCKPARQPRFRTAQPHRPLGRRTPSTLPAPELQVQPYSASLYLRLIGRYPTSPDCKCL